jgi:oligoribonuclease (3'-5' exoribonuclease)
VLPAHVVTKTNHQIPQMKRVPTRHHQQSGLKYVRHALLSA